MESVAEKVLEPGAETSDCKHLIFRLGEREYGIPIQFITEIIGLMDITPVPKTPIFLKGVINLRGKIIPVIDLRTKFEMEEIEYDERTCIIIVNISSDSKQNDYVGLVVDMVSEVFDISASDIETSLQSGLCSEDNFITGMGKIKDEVVILLNIASIVNFDTLKNM